jgi:hypothetical protein
LPVSFSVNFRITAEWTESVSIRTPRTLVASGDIRDAVAFASLICNGQVDQRVSRLRENRGCRDIIGAQIGGGGNQSHRRYLRKRRSPAKRSTLALLLARHRPHWRPSAQGASNGMQRWRMQSRSRHFAFREKSITWRRVLIEVRAGFFWSPFNCSNAARGCSTLVGRQRF